MEIKVQTLKEIAEQLATGMICFYHKTTGELESYPDELQGYGFDEEEWAEEINKVAENYGNYIRIEAMSSRESFTVMEDFIEGIEHIPTHNKFIDAISRKKPFSNFNHLLQYYPFIRTQWSAYKLDRYMAYVKEQLS